MEIKPIAFMKSDFKTKFGIPRQAGLTPELISRIEFESEYRNPDAIRGLENFSHIWIIWEFSENSKENWAATVRPPRFGGNERIGVLATRSPYRPNNLGLSCVEIESIDLEAAGGPFINVKGADLMDGTPIFDIKPYIPYSDCLPNATKAFASRPDPKLEVIFPDKIDFPTDKLETLKKILSLDPRPAYQNDPDRIYGFVFADYEIKFKVDNNKVIVKEIAKNAY